MFVKALRRLPIKIACGFLVTSVIGCAPSSVLMDSTYEPQETYTSNINYPLYVRSVSDIRKDKSSLGSLGLTDVSSDDLIKWLRNAFQHRGYKLDGEADSEPLACVVDISLKLAYIRSSSTSKATNIVLATSHGDSEEFTYYRGSHAGMNWNNSESEIKTSFTRALEQALDSVEAGLSETCQATNFTDN